MRKSITILLFCLFPGLVLTSSGRGQYLIFNDNFESGTPHASWGVYRTGEENVAAVAMNTVPVILEQGGSYAGLVHDGDASYNGAAIVLAGATSLKNYSIEGDVYCYVNHPGGSAYTGLVVYADSAAGTYIKLVADFDGDRRLRLYNNHLDVQTLKYTFDYSFKGAAVPGGIPTLDGWHRMKVEVETVDEATTAFWCYFDGELLGGCPIYDTSVHQMDAGQFGLYAFQMDTDGIAGYFDNIEVKPLAKTIFTDDFESGAPHESWGLYRAGEEQITAVPMNTVPVVLEQGGSYAGLAHDGDASYNGAAIVLAGATSLKNYSIEGDVYCYVNHPGGSAYTGLVVYADSGAGIYIKLVADFDGDKRLRLYNNRLDIQTLKYTFDYNFKGAAVPGGIPTLDGWHRMKVEVETIDEATTAFWCYFDGELLGGCPIYDTSVHQMDAGQFGLYAFQMDTDGIAGYFDNIVVKQYESVPTAIKPRPLTESESKPVNFNLSQNYPNPFNPETNIAFQINDPEFVELTIYDLLGRKIKNLISEQKTPGSYVVRWNGTDEYDSKVPSGVYIYTLRTGSSFSTTKKMIMMK